MLKRVFFAVNLPDFVKEQLYEQQKQLQDDFGQVKRAVKWVGKENLHITLLFLGSVREEKIESIITAARKVKINPFTVSLKKISYIPLEKRKARMIWATGSSKGIVNLQKEVRKCVAPEKVVEVERDFTLHVTLARIKAWEFRRTSLVKIPDISEDLDLSFEIKSFQLVESKTGPSYITLESFNL